MEDVVWDYGMSIGARVEMCVCSRVEPTRWLRCIRACSATIWICDNVKTTAVMPFYEPAV
mgnify:FL=1